MKCLVCEEPISQIYPDRHDVVHDAVVVKIQGNYGSEVYDPPMNDRVTNYLRAYLCDACLQAKAANGMIEMVQEFSLPKTRATEWRPGKQFVDPAPRPERPETTLAIVEILTRLRIQNGISQGDIATKCEVSQGTISRIERGQINPTVLLLEAYAIAVGTTLDALSA